MNLKNKKMSIGRDVLVMDSADVVGEVSLGDRTSVWFQVVLRGDVMPIVIGPECNIQDGSVIHGTYKKFAVTLHSRVSIGHGCMIHGCEIEEESLIGMGSVVMDGAHIGARSLVAAGSLVTQGAKFEPESLIMGRPAKRVRSLNSKELELVTKTPENYLKYKTWYESEGANNG